MTTIINALVAFDVLSANGGGASCHKTAIYAVTGPATRELLGHNEVDDNDFVVPPGFFVSVGSRLGELQPLLREKGGKLQPTHETLYDFGNPMSYEQASALAAERGIAIATPEIVSRCHASLGEDMPRSWYASNGHVMAFRLPEGTGDVAVPKPTWWSVQNGDGKAVVVVNLLTDEVYLIDKEQFVAQWCADADPSAKGEVFYDLIPVMDDTTFGSIIHTGSTAGELLAEQQKALELA